VSCRVVSCRVVSCRVVSRRVACLMLVSLCVPFQAEVPLVSLGHMLPSPPKGGRRESARLDMLLVHNTGHVKCVCVYHSACALWCLIHTLQTSLATALLYLVACPLARCPLSLCISMGVCVCVRVCVLRGACAWRWASVWVRPVCVSSCVARPVHALPLACCVTRCTCL
jgi:hypothetical protein